MKKLFALLLAGMMLLSCAACGSEKSTDADNTKPSASDSSAGTSAGTTDKDPTEQAAKIETALFTISYDDKVWNYIKDDLVNEDDYCYANLQIPEPEDKDYSLNGGRESG